ncbi:MAG: hypothetical protein Q9168_005319 [Polycauliona sp. 1 TL-2023]
MEETSHLAEEWIDDPMDWTPGPTEAQINLAAWLPSRPLQQGLGSLSVLPPEIRAKIWDLVLPTPNSCFKLRPLKARNWTVADATELRIRDNLRFAGASKQLHDEVTSRFYHKRSLAILFATFFEDHFTRPRSDDQSSPSMFGVVVNSSNSAAKLAAVNFAKFASIKLFMGLPFPLVIERQSPTILDDLLTRVEEFSQCLQGWQSRLGREVSCPKIHVVLYIAPPLMDEFDELFGPSGWREDRELENVIPSLKDIADLLQPLREFQNAKNATIEADFDRCFGKEWLPELMDQVASNMQKPGKVRYGRWRQPNMEVALAQSDLTTRRFGDKGDSSDKNSVVMDTFKGGPLPIGPPEEAPDNGIQ